MKSIKSGKLFTITQKNRNFSMNQNYHFHCFKHEGNVKKGGLCDDKSSTNVNVRKMAAERETCAYLSCSAFYHFSDNKMHKT